MRLLDGRELADYVKERQARQVRALRQAQHTKPTLAIIIANNDPVIDTYVRLKQVYGADILIDVQIHQIPQFEVAARIEQLNADESVHGIIIQLPISDPAQTDELVARIAPEKDVDGLGLGNTYISATAVAIDWLVNGYNVILKDRAIAVVGQGRLVGAPLTRLWQNSGFSVTAYDETTQDLAGELRKADIIVTATGVPGLITSQMISPGKVVVDAGTASENGVIVGDVAADVREREDLTITPVKGGVGPLTIAALFDAVIHSAQRAADEKVASVSS